MSSKNAGRVAVVDDEENIRETVGYALKREGYRVDLYPDGLAAWEKFGRELPDVLVLDIVMPRLDGLELCRRIRKVTEVLPIIFLTSRDEEFDRVLGLELGGDDYLVKPFAVRELLARVKVLFRRLALLEKPADGARREALSRRARARPRALSGHLERKAPSFDGDGVPASPVARAPARTREIPRPSDGGVLPERRVRQ